MPKALIFFCFLIGIQLIAILFLLFRPFVITPPGRVYPVIEKNFFYPNLILQGKKGAWKILDTHTTLPSPRIFAYTFFIFLGKLATLFDAQPVWVYLWSRVIAGILAFFATYWFIKTLLPKSYHTLAILFTLGVESGPLLTNLPALAPLVDGRMLLERNFGLPHHIFARALGLVFIGMLILSLQKFTPKRAIVLFFSGLLSAMSMPGYTFTFAASTFLPIAVQAFFTKRKSTIFPVLFLASIAILIPNIIFAVEFTKGIPWTNSTPNEKTWFTIDFIRMEYLSSLLLFVPFVIALLLRIKHIWSTWDSKLKKTILLMFCWIAGPMVWVTLAKQSWFPMPGHRLTDGYGYVPAGILAAVGFHSVNKRIAYLLLAATIVSSLFLTAVYTQKRITDPHPYPTKKTWEGILYLQSVPKLSGILALEQYGEIIPGFANVRVYLGGIHNFPDWLIWQERARQFFRGTMNAKQAKDFLQKSDISYIFYGPEERALGQMRYNELLQPVFQNSDVAIFQVIP